MQPDRRDAGEDIVFRWYAERIDSPGKGGSALPASAPFPFGDAGKLPGATTVAVPFDPACAAAFAARSRSSWAFNCSRVTPDCVQFQRIFAKSFPGLTNT
jgi:hypothetical protein